MAYLNFVGPVPRRRALDAVLLGGVSVLALLVGSQPGEALNLHSLQGSVAPTVAAQAAAAAAAAQAAAAATQAQSSLARAAQALATQQRLQAAAAAAGAATSVPNGLTGGGLAPDPNTPWSGANAPVQSTSGSQVTVDIQQTAPTALLYWNSFNVGANTTVNFQQQTSQWIAWNRVDNSTSPSQIFGKINALGAVYLINGNGIIFGAGSQVNVNTLVASSLDSKTNNPLSFSAATPTVGDIVVEPGASITAHIATDVSSQGSFDNIYLFGANVYNYGYLSAPAGEIGMVAAQSVTLIPNGYSALPSSVAATDSSGKPIFNGTEFELTPFSTNGDNAYAPSTGSVVHGGLIDSPRGIVIMNGDNVTVGNGGVISVDTSIDRNSMVMLRAATSVTMNGVITSLPFDDGSEPLPTGGSSGSAVQNFLPPYIEMTAQSTVTMGSTGLISAPSAVVSLRALDLNANGGDASQLYQPAAAGGPPNSLFPSGIVSNTPSVPRTVLLSPGAVIDVAGLENVTLPADYNFISIQPRNEFADFPLQRNGPLYGQTLWIDIRDSGTRSDGTSWVGTPLGDASGDISAVGRSIYQLMTTGGSVTLQTSLTPDGKSTVQTAGSVINVAGGNVNFLPGWVPATLLLGADGRIYSMADADPNQVYVGIANQFTVDHSRWGIQETWSTTTFSPGYSEGQSAGSLSVITDIPQIAGGTVYFGSVAGERQIADGQLPSQGSLSLISPTSVQIGLTPSDDYNTQSSVTELSADTLSGYGLSSLSITSNDLVVSSGSTLNLAPGGSFSVLTGGAIDIAGTVAAAGGSVSLVTDRFTASSQTLFKAPTDRSGGALAANIYVEGTIDVSGRFVNDTGRTGTDMFGPADINGGTISISTSRFSEQVQQGQWIDETGSILLASSSLLDVSSGGYISPLGQAKMASADVMAGQAGSISLSTYLAPTGAKYPWNTVDSQAQLNVTPTTRLPNSGILELDGTLRGYGFQSNGSLTLSGVDNIQIGGTLPAGATSNIIIGGAPAALPVSLFTNGGFGSYTIETVSDGWTGATANITVAAGVNLTLQQQNLSSLIDYTQVATGTKLGQQAAPELEAVPLDQRQPVNLTLNADYILLDKGSNVVTDPAAKITLGDVTYDPANVASSTNPTANTPAAVNVTLLGSIIDHGGSVFINATATQLGPQALVDLSGTFVANSTFGLPGGALTSGSYLSGGTFAVEAGTFTTTIEGTKAAGTAQSVSYYSAPSSTSYLISAGGAEVDVSGAAGSIEVAGPRGTTSSVWSWSDAGTFSADVSSFAWGGGFAAAGGRYVGTDGKTYADARANNGTFILGGASITLSQDTTGAIASAVANFFQNGTTPGAIDVAASQLAAFDNIYLYAATAPNGATRIFTDLNGDTYGLSAPVFSGLFSIDGSVNLDVANRLHIAAGAIVPSGGAINAQLTAPYIELTGGGGSTSVGTSTLTISGQTIDVEGASFSGFSQVNLISSGDIRLSTPKVADGFIPFGASTATDASTFTGSLTSSGNLLLSAQRIYPITAITFTISTPGNVQFTAPANSNTSIPLSAGGGINVIAANIDQGGNLFAPLGQITLGATGTTQSVTLEPGSLTSVTLADTVVPYGATLEGDTWYYNASANPLSEIPSKGVILAGDNLSVQQGSTIDLRGGGDLQAMQWVQGKGGSRDTLTTTPSGQTVYALVPSADASVAAYDIDFATSRSLDNGATVTAGDTNPLVGSQITIAGGGGIPAGTYTLYPAHYATLPGAMRVVVYQNSNLGTNIPSGTTLTDGTVLVAGNFTQSTAPGKQSAGQTVFAIQTNAVWQSYSEYQFTSANSYFRTLAAKNGTIIPLPIDAGRLQVIAQQSIDLSGMFLGQAGRDSSGNIGNGSELDISSPQMIDIVGDVQFASGAVPAGYVAVDVSELNDAGFASILIGGLRSNSNSGSSTLITPASPGILVDTQGEALTVPEILLVATPNANPGTGNVTIASGSVINTTGTVSEAAGRNYQFSSAAANGAMLVATNDATLNASGPTGTSTSANSNQVTINQGASITTKALTLQATASTNAIGIYTGALHVGQLNLAAPTVAIGSNSLLNNVGLALYNYEFVDVGALAVKALSGTITVYGNYNPGLGVNSLTLDAAVLTPASGSGDATISTGGLVAGVGTITLQNSGAAITQTSPTVNGQSPTLTFDAPNIVLGNAGLTSSQTILGYSEVDFGYSILGQQVGSHVSIAGPGGLTLGAASTDSSDKVTLLDTVTLNITTPGIVVAGASGANSSSFTIATGGNITVSDVQGGFNARPADSGDIGGNLLLKGANVTVGSLIQAQAGTITLEATSGNVTLNPRAYLDAGGYASTLLDVVTYVSGGKVVLQADAGNIVTSPFSVIDVSQPAGGDGYGGEIDVTATSGNATLAGLLLGSGGPGHGGSFNLDIQGQAGQSFDLTTLADQLLAGGVTGSINVQTGSGNLELALGHTLKANSITLTANDTSWNVNDPTQQFGQVLIYGTLDASGYAGTTSDGAGEAGGQVGLYGANAVLLGSTGVINASTAHADQLGGDVTVGIPWNANGKIYLQAFTTIDVSSAGGQGEGGTVTFIAPRYASDPNNPNNLDDMRIAQLAPGSNVEMSDLGGQINGRNALNIIGARSVAFDDFISFDTTQSNSNYGIAGAPLGWFGYIDPAGLYSNVTVDPTTGKLVTTQAAANSGTWTNITGWTASFSGPGMSGTPNAVSFTVNGTFYLLSLAPGGQQTATVNDPNGNPEIISLSQNQTSTFLTITDNGSTATIVLSGTTPTISYTGAGFAGTSPPLPTIRVSGSQGGFAFLTFNAASGKSGNVSGGDFNGINFIPEASSLATAATGGSATFIGSNNTATQTFLTSTLEAITQGNWTYTDSAGQTYTYTFNNLTNRLDQLVTQQLGANVVHVQPGVQLVNSSGDIIVASNWNLASGVAYSTSNNSAPSSINVANPNSYYIDFNYRLPITWSNGVTSIEAGNLTLRASGNLYIGGSISDGFFQFANYLDPTYLSQVENDLSASSRAVSNSYYLNSIDAPQAPYNPNANGVSPTSQDLALADLFPNSLNVCYSNCPTPGTSGASPGAGGTAPQTVLVTAPSSWSYTFTAGADLGSANPTARMSLASAEQNKTGNVYFKQQSQSSYTQTVFYGVGSLAQILSTQVQIDLPTMVRTGTGNITVEAAQDVVMQDTTTAGAIPGVIYAAGVNEPLLNDPGYTLSNGTVNITNPDGFLEPQIIAYATSASLPPPSGTFYGPPTAAAFPEMGGNVVINAQGNINGGTNSAPAYTPWLLSDSDVTPAQAGSLIGAGVFQPSGSQIASQSAWWIQYGSFQQGILSAGGNVDVVAGQDLINVSVSLPTTGRVSGGLTAGSTPQTNLYGSGNMVVRAGGNITGGSFYEGSGEATIFARGSIGTSNKNQQPDWPLLAVDTGRIEMISGGALSISGVVNPASLQTQQPSLANPLEAPGNPADNLYMDTYGPDSGVRLVADTGNLSIGIPSIPQPAPNYPASLEALALNGNLVTTGLQNRSDVVSGFVLSPSDHGMFELVAEGSVDLTFGYTLDRSVTNTTPRPYISAGSALIDTGFDPYQPNSGYDGSSSGALLAHADDTQDGIDATARIYAITGSITATGNYGNSTGSSTTPFLTTGYQIIEINRPASIYAGTDITDLNVIIQNIHASDVSTVTAGDNITYTGNNNGGGMQIAGPGFFVVQAGGDIGPFLPSNADNPGLAQVQEGIASVGNASATPVGDIYINERSIGIYDQALFGPANNVRRNTQLTTTGADVLVLFGIKSQPDYQAVINAYIDPATAGSGQAYSLNVSGLQSYLAQLGYQASDPQSALTIFQQQLTQAQQSAFINQVFAGQNYLLAPGASTTSDPQVAWTIFQTLSPDLQHVLVDQVFSAEIKRVAALAPTVTDCPQVCQPARNVINTLFPTPTDHTLGNGELNLLHSTIQTRLGGSISILGPGGDIAVGTLATEPNTNLKLRDLGIMTLGGGDINTYTDGNVVVNSSRVLTTQGGDITMWTSFGDLDAGRGSKTIVSAPAIEEVFDENDYGTVDPGGFVTGSGIGTLQASKNVPPANLYLVAPNGTIDFGTAGVRASGSAVFVAPVLSNASNFQVSGSVTGVPSIPSLSSSVAQSANTTTQSKPDADATKSGPADQASIFIVEVVGYGGGDDSSESSPNEEKKKPVQTQ